MCILYFQHNTPQFGLTTCSMAYAESGCCTGLCTFPGIWFLQDCLLWFSKENLVHWIPFKNLCWIQSHFSNLTHLQNLWVLLYFYHHPNGICKCFPVTIIMLNNTDSPSTSAQYTSSSTQNTTPFFSLYLSSFPILCSTPNQFALIL